jgi:hypothetical protein
LAVITPCADDDPSVSVESFENVANIHSRTSARGGVECKARAWTRR